MNYYLFHEYLVSRAAVATDVYASAAQLIRHADTVYVIVFCFARHVDAYILHSAAGRRRHIYRMQEYTVVHTGKHGIVGKTDMHHARTGETLARRSRLGCGKGGKRNGYNAVGKIIGFKAGSRLYSGADRDNVGAAIYA